MAIKRGKVASSLSENLLQQAARSSDYLTNDLLLCEEDHTE
jgi:hypothetical protein